MPNSTDELILTGDRLAADDWRSYRDLFHKIVDDLIDNLSQMPERPVWLPMDEEARQRLDVPVPWDGSDPSLVYEEFKVNASPFILRNNHPRFFGWVLGSSDPMSVIGNLISAAINPSVSFFDHSPALIEENVINWFRELMGFPQSSGGLLVSGCSVANFIGLACARESALRGGKGNQQGANSIQKLRVYFSSEAHSSVQRACMLLGLGGECLRKVEVDDHQRMVPRSLKQLIVEDHTNGYTPFCVVANAGGARTGAIDRLNDVADVCQELSVWLHIDGAFGALLRTSSTLRGRVEGLDRADSLAFDLHKWGFQPIGTGCVLVREAELQRRTFSAAADYIERLPQSASDGLNLSNQGIELSRRFRALGVWFSWRTQGLKAIASAIEKSVRMAEYLAEKISSSPDLELVGSCCLNIVNFRFVRQDLSPEYLESVNSQALINIQRSGIVMCSSARIRGLFCLRAAMVNHLANESDIDLLISQVVWHCQQILEV